MRGVWYTTGGGVGVLTAAGIGAGLYGAAWILAHLVELLAVGAGCAVLTGLAIRYLMAWSDQRAIRVWSQRPVQLHAAAVPLAAAAPPGPARAGITGGVSFNFYNYNLTPAEQAAVIRQAIPGPAGDAFPGGD